MLKAFFLVLSLAVTVLSFDYPRICASAAIQQRATVVPFPEGEKLIYEVKLSRFPIYTTLGTVTFEYLGRWRQSDNSQWSIDHHPAADEELLMLRAEAVSKGFLASLFGIEVRDRFETLVNERDFAARLSFKEISEGKRHFTQTALYDPVEQKVKYRTVDIAKPQNPPRAKELPLKEGMQSLLSAIYYVRLQELTGTIRFPVSQDEGNYEFEIQVRGKEMIQLDKAKIGTIKVEPKLFGPGRFFSRKGEMHIWLTDDERRIPVKLTAKADSSSITATLINFEAQPPPKRFILPTHTLEKH